MPAEARPATAGIDVDPPAIAPAMPEGEHATPVPEPNVLLLVGTGLLGVAITARLRRRPKPQNN